MDAPEQLKSYLDTEKITYERAGEALHVSRQTIWAWLTQGSVPGEAAKRDIEAFTGGKVPASAWPIADRRKPPGDAA